MVYNTAAYKHLFPPPRIALIDRVIAVVDEEFDRLFADQDSANSHSWGFALLECPCLPEGSFTSLDFEDVMLGYPVQDVAVTLYYGRGRDDYPDLREAFKNGYTSMRAWPVERSGQLETLMAARSVNFINYVARIDPSPEDYIQARCTELKAFLENHR